MSDARYFISIDLGTSQTLLAYFDCHHPDLGSQLLLIPQSIAPGQQQLFPSLPSLRFQCDKKMVGEATGTDNLVKPSEDPFGARDELLMNAHFGPLAEQLGAQIEGHLITGAKSWLSQRHLDPAQPILPWAAASGVSKLSAVDASASYLRYLLLAWNQQHPQHRLENQKVVITLPASFDDVARLYTQQAAARAGLHQVQFLEEPQAAFYDWYARHQQDLVQQLANIDRVLVCDIGGGTSDFSLIRVKPTTDSVASAEKIELQRIAVSQHILLGGDNIDAALAQQLLQKLKSNGQVQKLSKGRLQQWRLACRLAKEQLLTSTELTQVNVTLLGAGTRLIGDSFTEVLTREALMQLIAEGFFPAIEILKRDGLTQAQDSPHQDSPHNEMNRDDDNQSASAFSDVSLAYAKDPAITRHLRHFLAVHQVNPSMHLALLCNGGVLTSDIVQGLLINALQPSFQQRILHLDNPHPQHAVALGGIAYLRAQQGAFVPIRAQLPRNYFLQIAADDQRLALCILPKGSALGEILRVPEQNFVLHLGTMVRFELLMDQGQETLTLGDLRPVNRHHYQQLPALQLPLASQSLQRQRPIYLQASANALGNVQLQCVTLDEPIECWDLCFDLKVTAAPKLVLPPAVQQLLTACFGAKLPRHEAQSPIKLFKKSIEKIWGAKALWSVEQLRALADGLLSYAKARRRSALHEQVWWQWIGFTLRPGLGFVQDEQRMQMLLTLRPAGIQYQQDTQVWREWWLAWRRVSGGLSAPEQQQFFQLHVNQLGKALTEPLECFASFEHLTLANKIHLAIEIWQRLQQNPQITALWWSLGRLGSPYALYASQMELLPLELIEPWLSQLLIRDWQQQPLIAFTAVQLVQSGVNPALREAIEQKMKLSKCPASWLLLLSGEHSQDQQLYQRILGDSLPLGIGLNKN